MRVDAAMVIVGLTVRIRLSVVVVAVVVIPVMVLRRLDDELSRHNHRCKFRVTELL